MAGRYLPIHKLASGGMADVYLGVQSSPLGFQRLVAIKKIKPAFAKDDDFLTMFRDEANVCQYLQHSNIVQIVDFAPLDSTVAIVLEFIPGVNLLQFLNAHRTMNIHIPVPAALHIFCEVLKALAYVHERTDPSTGEPLSIIHRDLTPTNVIISGEGEVKLTDFGIAKARDNQHLTQAGTMKGKLNYVSPEQFDGLDLDGRTDIYSAGLLLWEMLTGKRLYNGSNEAELVKLLSTHAVDRNPRSFRKELDDDICSIVMTAISVNRDARHISARDLLKTMRGYLKQNVLSDFDLTAYVRRIMAKELLEHRDLIQTVLSGAKQLVFEDTKASKNHLSSLSYEDSLKPKPMLQGSEVVANTEVVAIDAAKTIKIDQALLEPEFKMVAGESFSLDLPSLPQQGQHLATPTHPAPQVPMQQQQPVPRRPSMVDPVMIGSSPPQPIAKRPLQPKRPASQGTPPIYTIAQVVFFVTVLLLIIFRHELRDSVKSILAMFK